MPFPVAGKESGLPKRDGVTVSGRQNRLVQILARPRVVVCGRSPHPRTAGWPTATICDSASARADSRT